MVLYIFDSINWLAVIIAALSVSVLGLLWFSDFMFGKEWRKEIKPEKNKLLFLATDYIMLFITAFSIELLIVAMNITGLKESVGLGLIVGVGITAVSMFRGYYFEGRSAKLFFISASYQALSGILMAIVLGILR